MATLVGEGARGSAWLVTGLKPVTSSMNRHIFCE
jgi:hypothetical protein